MTQRLSRYPKKVKKNFHYYLKLVLTKENAGLFSTLILAVWSLILTIEMKEITISQYNMSARIENEKTFEMLNGRIRDYNSLVIVMADLDVDLVFYRLSKQAEKVGNEVLRTSDLRERIAFLDKAQNHLMKYAHIGDLFPNTTCLAQWSNCTTNLIAYNTACKAQMKSGMLADTSAIGIQQYRNTLYTVNDLIDSMRAHIDVCKATTEKQAKIVKKEIDATLPLSHAVKLSP